MQAFFDGVNDLSLNETRLADAYEELGHPELAECARGGKLYQRLPMVVGQAPDVVQLHAFQHALTGERGKEDTIEEWVAARIEGPYGRDLAVLKSQLGRKV